MAEYPKHESLNAKGCMSYNNPIHFAHLARSAFSRFCFTVTLTFLVCQGANAGDIVIISNSKISLSPDEVKDIYIGKKQFAGSTRLSPVDNAALQEAFLHGFLIMLSVRTRISALAASIAATVSPSVTKPARPSSSVCTSCSVLFALFMNTFKACRVSSGVGGRG